MQGCNEAPRSVVSNGYFDVDSLIRLEVAYWDQQSGWLVREVTLEGETESDTLQLAPGMLGKELEIFSDINPAEAKYRNAFEAAVQAGETRYQNVDEVGELRELVIRESADGLVSIAGQLRKETSIYARQQWLTLVFQDGRLMGFDVKGYQKTVASDTARFSVTNRLIRE